MAEPNSSTALAALSAAFGVSAIAGVLGAAIGPWVLVLVGAVFGATAAAAEPDTTLRRGLLVFVRGFILAVLFAGAGSVILAPYAGAAAEFLLLPLSGFIAWQHRRAPEVLSALQRRFLGKPDAPKDPPP